MSVRYLRVAEITKLDMTLSDTGAVTFRARVSLSFRYETPTKPKTKTKTK